MVLDDAAALLETLAAAIDGMGSHSLMLFTLAIMLYIASTFAWALRWWYLLGKTGRRPRFRVVYESVLGGILVNNLTPSLRAGGEGFRVFWLKLREGIPASRGIVTTLYERVSEVPPVAVLVLIGLHHLGLPVLPGVYSVKDGIKRWMEKIRREAGKILGQPRVFIVASAVSSLIWLQDVVRLYLIAHAVGLDVPLGLAATLSVSYLVLGLTPTPAGVGFVEGGLIGILVRSGYPLDSAIALVTLERLVSTVMPSVLGALMVAVNAKNMGLTLREVLREAKASMGGGVVEEDREG